MTWQAPCGASRSENVNECVEVANLGDGRAVRDSKDPTGPALTLTAATWTAFTAGVKSGEFD
jgi:hypothetical protein